MKSAAIKVHKKMVVVDKPLLPLLNNYKWTIKYPYDGYPLVYAYVESGGKRRHLPMHRLLLGNIPRKSVVDHINGDPLDNRLSNLRICSVQQNCWNKRGPTRRSKSKILGVFFHKGAGKWTAEICKDRKNINLGFYSDRKTAYFARRRAERKLYGVFKPYRRRSA